MIYKTKSGDMWDSIAYNELGDESFIDDLINANLDHKDTVIFDSGVELTIPVIDRQTDAGINYSQPPWR